MALLWSLLSDFEKYILKFVLSELESRLGKWGSFFQMVGEAETRIWIHSIRLTIFTLTPVLALTLLVSAFH